VLRGDTNYKGDWLAESPSESEIIEMTTLELECISAAVVDKCLSWLLLSSALESVGLCSEYILIGPHSLH
jgi:hypothetical protein